MIEEMVFWSRGKRNGGTDRAPSATGDAIRLRNTADSGGIRTKVAILDRSQASFNILLLKCFPVKQPFRRSHKVPYTISDGRLMWPRTNAAIKEAARHSLRCVSFTLIIS